QRQSQPAIGSTYIGAESNLGQVAVGEFARQPESQGSPVKRSEFLPAIFVVPILWVERRNHQLASDQPLSLGPNFLDRHGKAQRYERRRLLQQQTRHQVGCGRIVELERFRVPLPHVEVIGKPIVNRQLVWLGRVLRSQNFRPVRLDEI